MAGYYNGKAERDRVKRDNDPARILQLAQRDEGFSVSLRWRDDGLRSICFRMVKCGMLKRAPLERGQHTFHATEGATIEMYQRRAKGRA